MGAGTYGTYALDSLLRGLTGQFDKLRLINTSGTVVMSDILTATWEVGVTPTEEMALDVSGGAYVFTISQAGTVNALQLLDSANALKATVSLTPVVYATPTYYTLAELILYLTN